MASPVDGNNDEDRRKRKRLEFDGEMDDSPARDSSTRRFTRSSLSSPSRSEGAGSSRQIHMAGSSRQPPVGNVGRVANPIPARLPPRLFPDGLIPGGGRVNSYSHPEHLLALRDILEGTEELEYIKESPLGKLFQIQTRKAGLSGKLIHQFLGRSLVTRKKHEIWYVFGGRPIRYGLKEFGYLTGLNCDPYPSESEMEALRKVSNGPNSFWKRLIGQREHCLVTDILDMLRYDRQKPRENRMSPGRRLRLALVVIVEGILIPTSSSGKASREVVEQVKSVQGFLKYPWGRKSFELTLEMVMYGNHVNSTVDVLRDKLRSSHLTIHGFTLAFQLHILTTVPKVCELLPDKAEWLDNFLEPSIEALPNFRSFHNDNIRKIENNRELQVISILGFGFPLESDDFSWTDEVEDPSVNHLLHLLDIGHIFRRDEWVAGNLENPEPAVEPPVAELPPVQSPTHRENVLGLPKSKQLTIRKMLAGKSKKVSKGSEGKQKGKAVVVADDDESSDSSDDDEYYLSKRMKIIEVLDLVLAEIKSEKSTKKSRRQRTDRNSGRVVDMGRSAGIVIREGHNISEKLVSSVSGGSAAPKAQSDVVSSAGVVKPPVESVQVDNVNEMVNFVLDDLAKDKGVANIEQLNETNCVGQTIETGGPSMAFKVNETPQQGEVMSPRKIPVMEVPVTDELSIHLAEETEKDRTEPQQGEVMSPRPIPDMEVAVTDELSIHLAEETEKDRTEHVPEPVTREDLEKLDFDAETDVDRDGGRELANDPVLLLEGVAATQKSNEDEIVRMVGDDDDHDSDKDAAEFDLEMTDNEDEKEDETQKPLRVKRERKIPQKFGQEDSLSSCENSGIDDNLKKQFLAKLGAYRKNCYTVNGHSQPKSFYKDIYKPRTHTGTEHINALLCCVWRRLSSYLLERRVAILDTWFTELLVKDHNRYMKKRKGESSFIWNNTLRKYVVGEVDNRTGRLGWLVDVDEVYAPMNIGTNHWVAICIELKNGRVVVYDCNIDNNSEAKMSKAIKPVTEILPFLIEEVALTTEAAYTPPTIFVHERPTNVYQNKLSGDSGPLSVKFIEERSQGLSIDGFTDKSVDSIRLMYAMEAYSEFQEPLAF